MKKVNHNISGWIAGLGCLAVLCLQPCDNARAWTYYLVGIAFVVLCYLLAYQCENEWNEEDNQ